MIIILVIKVLFVKGSVRSGMVQYAAVLQRLFSQTLSAWTPAPESSLGQQRAYRYTSSRQNEPDGAFVTVLP